MGITELDPGEAAFVGKTAIVLALLALAGLVSWFVWAAADVLVLLLISAILAAGFAPLVRDRGGMARSRGVAIFPRRGHLRPVFGDIRRDCVDPIVDHRPCTRGGGQLRTRIPPGAGAHSDVAAGPATPQTVVAGSRTDAGPGGVSGLPRHATGCGAARGGLSGGRMDRLGGLGPGAHVLHVAGGRGDQAGRTVPLPPSGTAAGEPRPAPDRNELRGVASGSAIALLPGGGAGCLWAAPHGDALSISFGNDRRGWGADPGSRSHDRGGGRHRGRARAASLATRCRGHFLPHCVKRGAEHPGAADHGASDRTVSPLDTHGAAHRGQTNGASPRAFPLQLRLRPVMTSSSRIGDGAQLAQQASYNAPLHGFDYSS